MAHLAIKGHAIRSKEVIGILEMMGGINKYNLIGDTDEWFVLNGTQIQRTDWIFAERGFTLEEFLEKFPYKVGDKVSSKYLKNYEVSKMEWESANNRVIYKLQGMGWYSADELQPYKEETMENKPNLLQQLKEYFENTPQEVIETEWHEYAKYNEIGPSVEEYLEYVNNIRQPQYPKTYEECCKIIDYHLEGTTIIGYEKTLLENFQKLLICRDAYWKIAGDWKPDWNDNSKFKYTITCKRCNIIMYSYSTLNCILAFPTAEIRDVFYGNFKELIETCKEFL